MKNESVIEVINFIVAAELFQLKRKIERLPSKDGRVELSKVIAVIDKASPTGEPS